MYYKPDVRRKEDNKTELKPVLNSNRSYYKKAFYRNEHGYIILRSYNTDVIAIKDGEVFRLWWDYSVTTMKHINDFLYQHGYKTLNKKEWESLQIA